MQLRDANNFHDLAVLSTRAMQTPPYIRGSLKESARTGVNAVPFELRMVAGRHRPSTHGRTRREMVKYDHRRAKTAEDCRGRLLALERSHTRSCKVTKARGASWALAITLNYPFCGNRGPDSHPHVSVDNLDDRKHASASRTLTDPSG